MAADSVPESGYPPPSRPAVPVKIGSWLFDPGSGELRRGGETRRIEFRAAQALTLLCRRRGEIVTHREILDHVWGGRVVSPNSLAVVIGDIRRALGDDARRPHCLETVSKRGYRLAGQPEERAARGGGEAERGTSERPTARRLAPFAMLLALIAAASAAGLLLGSAHRNRPAVIVEAVRNESGSAALDPSAGALTELAVERLSRTPGIDVYRGASPGDAHGTRFILRSKLILWDGHPTLSLQAVDPGSGRILWSGMAGGPPFYPGAARQLDRLAAFLRARP